MKSPVLDYHSEIAHYPDQNSGHDSIGGSEADPIDRLLCAIQQQFGVTLDDLRRRTKLRKYTHARNAACYLAMICGYNLNEMARRIGRHPSYAHHAAESAKTRIAQLAEIAREVESITAIEQAERRGG